MFDQALQASDLVVYPDMAGRVAALMIAAGRATQLVSFWRDHPPRPAESSVAFDSAIRALVDAGRLDEARALADLTRDHGYEVRLSIVAGLVRVGRLDDARALVVAPPESDFMRGILVGGLADAGRFDEAEHLGRTIRDRVARSGAEFRLAVGRAQSATPGTDAALEAARRAVDAIPNSWSPDSLGAVVAILARAGHADEARALPGRMGSPGRVQAAARDVALALADAGYLDDALGVIRPMFAEGPAKPYALYHLGSILAESGDDRAHDVLVEAGGAVSRMWTGRSSFYPAQAAEVAPAIARAWSYPETRAAIEDSRNADIVRETALQLVAAGRLDDAVTAAPLAPTTPAGIEARIAIAAAIAGAGSATAAAVFLDAKQVRQETPDRTTHETAKYEIAQVFARDGDAAVGAEPLTFDQIAVNLEDLGKYGLDAFIRDIARLAPSFERMRPGLSIDVLREAVTTAAWVRPDWQRVAQAHGIG